MKNWVVESVGALGILMKASIQMIRGIYRLARLRQPVISVFGGKAAHEHGKYTAWAYDFASRCGKDGFSVITGGGPGIMEAANCGAYEATKQDTRSTLGIEVKGVDKEFKNPCTDIIMVDQFFVRKWLLMRYSCAYVLFPGGIGTMDEFFDVLNMMKLNKTKKVPIVLVGSSYWHSFLEWYKHAFEYELIEAPAQSYFVVTDDIDEAFRIVSTACKKIR